MSTANDWRRELRPPREAGQVDSWFAAVARQLLCRCRLVVAGHPHRIVEVEFYYHTADHPDPYSHRHPIQLQPGRWYFHRSHGSYRAGSFKGLDITCGTKNAFGGILIRGLEMPDGTLIDGPSLCVDHLLSLTGIPSVPGLDASITDRRAWDSGTPLYLDSIGEFEARPIHRSARVGLGFKRLAVEALASRFLFRPYRFLTEPRRTRKGRPLLVLALHGQGLSVDEICCLTGSPRTTVTQYVSQLDVGRQEKDVARFTGQDLTANDLCRLHGALSVLEP